jgi:hypothetical protein
MNIIDRVFRDIDYVVSKVVRIKVLWLDARILNSKNDVSVNIKRKFKEDCLINWLVLKLSQLRWSFETIRPLSRYNQNLKNKEPNSCCRIF